MKTQQAQQITSSACSIDFHGLSYSPALLLDARLDASITDHPEFSSACQIGFEVSCKVIQEDISTGDFPYNRSVFTDFVRNNLLHEDGSLVRGLGHCVGFVLGGLSALALAHYQEAQEGLSELVRLLDREQRSQQWSSSNSRSVDSAGWPLDL